MARAKTNKLYRTFTKGLITEASYLTYPEDASVDELNTVISRKGNRTRRVGIDYQDDFVLEDLGIDGTKVVNEYVWNSVNNDATVNFVCIQVGPTVYFYTLNEGPVSANKLPFTIDLSGYVIAGGDTSLLDKQFAGFTSGSGFLFICHEVIAPLSVEYDDQTNELVVTPIVIQIRDLEGVDDGLENDAEPPSLTALHHYNLLNQGWIGGGATSTQSGNGGTYNPNTPPNTGNGMHQF